MWDISVFRSFRYNDEKQKLVGVAHPDPIRFSQLIGYKAQFDQLIDNTLAFLNGYNANNVLLVGSRGTGKSSSVKALVNEYHEQGLRLLEITKEQIEKLPDILKLLRPRGRKFIIFIDDLSFDEGEMGYKYMKSLLEGGSEGKPDNVLFYATSIAVTLFRKNGAIEVLVFLKMLKSIQLIHLTKSFHLLTVSVSLLHSLSLHLRNISISLRVLLLNAILNLTKRHFSNRLCSGKSDRKVCLVEQQNNLSITLCGIHKRKISNIFIEYIKAVETIFCGFYCLFG